MTSTWTVKYAVGLATVTTAVRAANREEVKRVVLKREPRAVNIEIAYAY